MTNCAFENKTSQKEGKRHTSVTEDHFSEALPKPEDMVNDASSSDNVAVGAPMPRNLARALRR